MYVVLTLNEGLVFKQLKNELAEHGHLQLISLNPAYQTYQLGATEIREIWKFVHYINKEVAEPQLTDNQVALQLKILSEEINQLKQKFAGKY